VWPLSQPQWREPMDAWSILQAQWSDHQSTHAERGDPRLTHIHEGAEPLEPISRAPLYEQVADRLRKLIEAKELSPGDRLPAERDLAARLGVSRSSVRQALTMLRVMGLLEVRHGTGVYLLRPVRDVIPPIALKSVGDDPVLPAISDVREVLESYAARMAARQRTAVDLATMAHAIAEMETEIARGESGLEGDRRFHRAVIAAARNPVLPDLMLRLQPTVDRISQASLARPGQPPRSLATHRLIMEAVTHQDEEEAARLMQDHLAITGALDSVAEDA